VTTTGAVLAPIGALSPQQATIARQSARFPGWRAYRHLP
jgi:hypothetical protein